MNAVPTVVLFPQPLLPTSPMDDPGSSVMEKLSRASRDLLKARVRVLCRRHEARKGERPTNLVGYEKETLLNSTRRSLCIGSIRRASSSELSIACNFSIRFINLLCGYAGCNFASKMRAKILGRNASGSCSVFASDVSLAWFMNKDSSAHRINGCVYLCSGDARLHHGVHVRAESS